MADLFAKMFSHLQAIKIWSEARFLKPEQESGTNSNREYQHPKRITTADIDLMSNRTEGQRRLMKVLVETDLEAIEDFDKILVEALDARDVGHATESESLFREAIAFAENATGSDGYLVLPGLLHFADFLQVQGRKQEFNTAFARYKAISALYK